VPKSDIPPPDSNPKLITS